MFPLPLYLTLSPRSLSFSPHSLCNPPLTLYLSLLTVSKSKGTKKRAHSFVEFSFSLFSSGFHDLKWSLSPYIYLFICLYTISIYSLKDKRQVTLASLRHVWLYIKMSKFKYCFHSKNGRPALTGRRHFCDGFLVSLLQRANVEKERVGQIITDVSEARHGQAFREM